MSAQIEKKTTWWQEPMAWMIFALPLVAVIAGLTTVWIAYKKADTLVSDYYSKDIGVSQANDMDKRAHFLAISADLKVSGDMIKVDLSGKLGAKPKLLLLKLVHPTNSQAADIILALQPSHMGEYTAVLPSIPAGVRDLVLEPQDRTWRLTGVWEAPFSGTLHLSAKSVSDSSMLP